MVKTLLYLIITIFLITFVRAVVGIIGKGVADLFQPDSPAKRDGGSEPQAGAELKKDPVCGIYVSSATKVRKSVNGKDYCFCSEKCRDQFSG